jgi:UDP-glucose 4-epimerase
MHILVTGGAGYIGSHTAVELLTRGHDVTIVDNLVNSKPEALHRIAELAGRAPEFHQVDLLDRRALEAVMALRQVDAVMHFAGLKAVGESVAQPLAYYRNNLTGTLELLGAMRTHGVDRLVFSSSATVYGIPERVPIREDFPLAATNPYGQTKLMIEIMLRDLHAAEPAWGIAILRYFNPIGAHRSGRLGEDPNGLPNNLLPYVSQVAIGKLERLRVFGNDYPTPDGTGVRDYIHVVDLALGHLAALDRLVAHPGELLTVNLGTGRGYSVLEMVRAFERASGRQVPYEVVARRPGDVASCYADPAQARALLGWQATRGIDEMCADAWRWQAANPAGFEPG